MVEKRRVIACWAVFLSGVTGTLSGAPAVGLRPDRVPWEPPVNAVHIDPTANVGHTADGSRERPFASLERIQWRDGGVYVLRRGTVLEAKAFTVWKKDVTLASYGEGKRPVIRCVSVAAGRTNQHAIRADVAPSLTIRDLEIVAPKATSCIRLNERCSGARVTNCLLRGAVWGIRAFRLSGLTIVDTEVRDIKDDGMFIMGVTDMEIAHCFVHDVNQNWRPPYTSQKEAGGDAIQFLNCDRWHVHHCELDRANSGNKFCFISNGPKQKMGIFEHNLTRGPLTTGDGGASVYFHDGDGLIVRHNTILAPSPGMLYSHSTNLNVYGNVVVGVSGGVFASKSARVAHNVFWDVEGTLASGGHVTFVNNAGRLAVGKDSLGKVRRLDAECNLLLTPEDYGRTPLFVAPEELDFRMRPDSPGIDAGRATDVEIDRLGTTIPQGQAPDIGAYERQ
ncbi:MAG: right-handed parallel beta-helix repeat-containing protein [Lentisphaerae bacterium]|nr:right-handed parallel beta-helix repeat-containing protein [Lentisphaerota bacterium]MBT5608593.1 right-handed parallel beta-helix repeat-containing protein [Lentisphaerota bacterium]MBT7054940.1 right-handed parallel beta-helix repeat-containing protein [Lentisphaerota bacterium]MBT7842787.1 right-handed parallel beta-helix repeat-containing protein [Lentisphaerota bacterium]